jgi:hypothetical protein
MHTLLCSRKPCQQKLSSANILATVARTVVVKVTTVVPFVCSAANKAIQLYFVYAKFGHARHVLEHQLRLWKKKKNGAQKLICLNFNITSNLSPFSIK